MSAAAAKTTVGASVEVQVTDFSKAGFAAGLPKIWVKGTVVEVAPIGREEDGRVNVKIQTEDGTWQNIIVGKRGGGAKTIRIPA
jgi:hypothetical protein